LDEKGLEEENRTKNIEDNNEKIKDISILYKNYEDQTK
jgi:hypothetical protein